MFPGSLAFIKYANSKGVKVFYVSNRKAPQEEATRNNLKALGYPIDESEDTVLLKGEMDDWGSKKGTRRTVITQTYRLVMIVGDNFGDFVDGQGLQGGASRVVRGEYGHVGQQVDRHRQSHLRILGIRRLRPRLQEFR